MRAAFVAALVVLVLSAAPVAAAEPTLGARLSPVVLTIEKGSTIELGNRSTIPVTVHVDPLGDGWAIDVTDFPLAVDEDRTLTITSAGEGEAVIRATLTPVGLPASMDAAALVIESKVRHASPWETLPPYWWLVCLVGGFLILFVVRRAVLARERPVPRGGMTARIRISGQGLAEYALILALIAIVAIVGLLFLGGQISTQLQVVGNAV